MELVFFFFLFFYSSAFLYCIVVCFFFCLITLFCLVWLAWLAWCIGFIHSKRMFFHSISDCYTYSPGFMLFIEYYSEFQRSG